MKTLKSGKLQNLIKDCIATKWSLTNIHDIKFHGMSLENQSVFGQMCRYTSVISSPRYQGKKRLTFQGYPGLHDSLSKEQSNKLQWTNGLSESILHVLQQ